MDRVKTRLLLSSIAVLAIVSFSQAAEEKTDVSKVDTTAKKVVCANCIDFKEELGLNFSSLTSLGTRIESARTSDPAALAAIAAELAVLERVSGKTATINSKELMAEAVEAGRRRNISAELKAVALSVSDTGTKAVLEAQAQQADEAITARKAGEKQRGITCTLNIFNHTPVVLDIYVNHQLVGFVAPFGSNVLYVGDCPFDTTKLFAQAGCHTWGPTFVPQPVQDFTWNLR
jgi:hypothetical protein